MKNTLDISISSIEELPQVAKTLLDFIGNEKTVLFYAPMGAGKTTLIKELCKTLGSTDNFSSPTYGIVNEYAYPNGKIFHFDLYRLTSLEELLDIGVEDYLASNDYCFFEWAELAENLVDTGVKVEISLSGNIRYLHAAKF